MNVVKKELSLDCSFAASLYKLLLYQPGSFFKCHRDSEKADNMFATLVVQLPSKFSGGQLVVQHDGKTKIFDFSSMAGSSNNTFSTFFTAFYCDCEHEILPITEGYRLCLVYNLIAIKTEVPTAPKNRELEMELIKRLSNWEGSRKLVYALTHKYSEASLDYKNMKTTDKIVADILLRASQECELHIFLAFFEKDCTGDYVDGDEDANCSGCASEYDGNFDGEFDEVSYRLKVFFADGNKKGVVSSHLSTNFNKEVIPTACFDAIEPYQQDCEHTGNEGVHVTKSYRCAAITVWPKKFTFQVLKSSRADTNIMDMFFIKEAETYFNNGCNAQHKENILQWADFVASQKRYSISGVRNVVATIIKFNNKELIQKLIPNGVARSPEAFSLILKECDKLGWQHFSAAMVDMIKGLEKRHAIKILNMFFGNDRYLDVNKSTVFLTLLHAVFEKSESTGRLIFHFSTVAQRKEDKELLEPLVNVVLRFNNPQLMEKLIKFLLPLHSETIPLLAKICYRYGWQSFVTAIEQKYSKKSKKDQINILTWLIQIEPQTDDKKNLCLNLFGILFDKTEEFFNDQLPVYNRTNSEAVIMKRRKDEKELLEPLINATRTMDNLQLLKDIFQRMALHSETIPLMIIPSQLYGWRAFATELGNKFAKLSQIDAIDSLSMLIGMENFNHEMTLCFNLFQLILDKKHTPLSNNLRRITQGEQAKFLKEKYHILLSVCCLAEKIKFNLLTFAQRQSFKDFVPVLLLLAQNSTTNRLSTFWSAVTQHFITEMHNELTKAIEISWRHCIDSLYACCNDCTSLINFIGSNKRTEAFRMGEHRRKHLQHRINLIGKLSHRIENTGRGQVGVLVVTKTETNASDAIRNQNLSKALLDKLRAAMPHN